MPHNKKLFLSIASSEFASYRQLLATDLKRPSLDVAVQEDFVTTGGSTLQKLDDYIRSCHGVIHVIGKATGSVPPEMAVQDLLSRYPDFAAKLPPIATQLGQAQPGFSYTQWEAWLALYHQRNLFVYRPADFDLAVQNVPRGPLFVFSADEQTSQRAHYLRICEVGQDRGQFLNEERLSSAVLRDLVEILPALQTRIEVPPTRLRHSAERLIGRDAELALLDAAWNETLRNVFVVRAFGGMGKTSLVASWMAELALKDWRGAARVFDWSFYSQGSSNQRAASADTFIAAALAAFGDPDPVLGSPWDRGARLARLVGKQRGLLVLDGLEPLQYPPGPMLGKLKDQAVEALLKGLAAQNAGLCVVTTREKVPDIQQHYGRTAIDLALPELTELAGAALLHHHGANRAGAHDIQPDDKELRDASHEVRGHGLTLQLLGQYLRLAEDGDIRKRGTVRLADADHEYQNDATRPYGHAFKAMEAYETWFQREGEAGQRQLAALRLLGLFDRPATKDCLDALCEEPVIAGLTESLVSLSVRDWKLLTKRLQDINLLSVQIDGGLDAHPLLREYFAMHLRTQQPEAWREAHRRIYEHLCETTKEGEQPTLEDLQPLYQAVTHGCLSGLQKEACEHVYINRILRGDEHYTWHKLAAFGSELGALACFFEETWSRLSPSLTDADQAWLLNEAAFCLRAVGRLTEAREPMRSTTEMNVNRNEWLNAAVCCVNLSQLELTLGEVLESAATASRGVTYADRIGRGFESQATRVTHAEALHQNGQRLSALSLFVEAEHMQAREFPAYPLLHSAASFRYCDLLLAEAEFAAWQSNAAMTGNSPERSGVTFTLTRVSSHLDICREVSERTTRTSRWMRKNRAHLNSAFDHLTLGRAALYASLLGFPNISDMTLEIESAVSSLRKANRSDHLPRGLLTRAWHRSIVDPRPGPESAQTDLDEAWEIAERGPMPLFLADIHLYRARLFFREPSYPWESPQHDLAEARRLIFKHGYLRRKDELEHAEALILKKE